MRINTLTDRLNVELSCLYARDKGPPFIERVALDRSEPVWVYRLAVTDVDSIASEMDLHARGPDIAGP